MNRASNRREAWQRVLHTLRESPGLGRLALVRFSSQFGDGMFQAALGGAILFNPERETDPVAIAAGFAVLLLPYSVIGPFAGALLDRWDRRLVLLWASVLRGLFILTTAVLLVAGGGDTLLLTCALAAIGVSRFVGAGVSAALPKVVRQSWLVATNSVLTTAGSVVAALGASAAVAIIGMIGAGDRASGAAVAIAALGSVIAALAAARFTARSLGPVADEVVRASAVRSVTAGLRTGATAVWEAPGVTTAMIGIGAHRICFGINTLIMVLVLRDTSNGSQLPGGMAGFGVAVGATIELPAGTHRIESTSGLATGIDVEVITWLDDHSRYALSLTAHTPVTGEDVVTTFRAAVDLIKISGRVALVVDWKTGKIIEDCTKDDFFGTPRSERAQLFLSKILHH